MKTIYGSSFYFILGGLIAMLGGCNFTNDRHSSSDTLKQISPGQLSSRVFDGRDSLITGDSGPTATKDNFAIVTQFIEVNGGDDVGRVGIADPDNLDPATLLFESRAGNPILTPEGDQITWGTFSGAKGAITVQCTRKATHATVHLAGLIPNGVYSIRNELFDPGTGELMGRIGFTGLRGSSKTKSSFRASAGGEGHVSGLIMPGALDMGLIGDCMLNDATKAGEYIWHTVAIYQMDGTPELDADGTFVEQGGFTFGDDSPSIDIQ